MITRVRAACVLPMCAPALMPGWIDVEAGRIVAVGEGDAKLADARDAVDRSLDLGQVVVLPGLVNAHTHLELSHLRGKVPPAPSFLAWVGRLLAERAAVPAPDTPLIDAALGEAIATGTAALGDVGNTSASVASLTAARIDAWHFDERIGFRTGDAAGVAEKAWTEAALRAGDQHALRLRCGVAPHAPYSTSPGLIQAIAAGLDADPSRRATLHVAESLEEGRLLADGTGPWRDMLERLGVWEPTWTPPATSTVGYLEGLGVLHARMLMVHGTQCTTDDLGRLAAAGCTLVLCARSNAWVGVGAPPVAAAFASGVRVAVGTDSLASVENLNMFEELSALAQLAPGVSSDALLLAATTHGAQALGFTDLGTLAPGQSARAVVVDLPRRVCDARAAADWLVRDAAAARLRWLDECVEQEAAA